MNKTFSITDERVINRLDEIKSMGIQSSRYISDLVLDDINSTKFSKAELIDIIIKLASNTNPTYNEYLYKTMNNNTEQNTDLMLDKINNILNIN